DIPRSFSMPLKKLYRLAAAIMIPLLLAGGLAGFFITKSLIPAGSNGSFTTIFSPGGQKTRVTLPDNSIVWLNAKTTLRYASAFKESQRSVYLDGEAFFDVKHDSQHPFIVKTSAFNIKVYGTTFNVKAYKEEGVTEATLVKGKISIEGLYLKGQNSDEYIIHPNETFRYIKDQATFKKANEVPSVVNKKAEESDDAPLVEIAEKVDVTPIVAWKDGKLIIKDESFLTLSHKLEQWYNVKIHFEDKEVQEIRYTGMFEKENIDQVLKYLQMLTPFEYDMKLNEITIRYQKNAENKKGGNVEIQGK
ncbi:MAG: FecR family protein, partial [Bacteroidota bacterium]|nr:FecR family protein [Bacteroidota bacterium]